MCFKIADEHVSELKKVQKPCIDGNLDKNPKSQ